MIVRVRATQPRPRCSARVNRDATTEQIVALVAVLCVPQAPATPTHGIPSEWLVSSRPHPPQHPRPGGWRASGLPH